MATGWDALAERYKAPSEPQGKKLTAQTVKVGSVRWRRCVTVILSTEGLYLQLLPRLPLLSAIFRKAPVLIPWSELRRPRKGWLYLGTQAVELSVGEPELARITFPIGLYNEIASYLDPAMRVGWPS